MVKAKKEFEIKKIVEWNDEPFRTGEKWNDKLVLQVSFICMIPIIGQIWWIIMLMWSLKDRKKKYVAKEI